MKQAGFTAIEVLLAIVVLGLVGATSYYVISRSDDSSATSKAAAPVTANTINQAVTQYANNESVLSQQGAKVAIAQQSQDHALGNVVSSSGENKGVWFASKQDGSWKIVSQTSASQCDNLTAAGLSQWEANCTP